MKCKICGNQTESFTKAVVMRKHEAQYFACPACEFIQTEEPFWLKEAYAAPINRSDFGYVSRNLYLAKMTQSIIVSFFDPGSRFIDYGGGYGLFVRLLR